MGPLTFLLVKWISFLWILNLFLTLQLHGVASAERERACGGLPGRLPGVDGRPDVGGHAALRQLRRRPPRAQGTRASHRRRVGPKGEFLRVQLSLICNLPPNF